MASKHEVLLVFLREVLGVGEDTAELDACKVEHLLSEETGAALVRLIRFARSGQPEAQAFLSEFRRTTAHCPSGRTLRALRRSLPACRRRARREVGA